MRSKTNVNPSIVLLSISDSILEALTSLKGKMLSSLAFALIYNLE